MDPAAVSPAASCKVHFLRNDSNEILMDDNILRQGPLTSCVLAGSWSLDSSTEHTGPLAQSESYALAGGDDAGEIHFGNSWGMEEVGDDLHDHRCGRVEG